MSRKQKIIVSITGIVLVSLILIGLTYAYFLTVITGNTNTKSISVTTANLSLTYSDNSDVITGDKILPGTTLTPKTFTVTNNGNKNIDSYKVGLVNILNTFTRTGDIVYTLTCKSSVVNKTCNGVTEKEFPNLNSYIVENEIDKNELQTYTLTVTYKEKGVDQSDDMNKELSAKIDIFDSNSLSIQGNVVNSSSNDYVVIHSKEQISEIVNGKYKFIGIEPDNHTISIKNKNTTSVKNTTLEVTKQSDSSFNNNQINYSDTNKVADMDINIDGSNINLDITNLSDGIPTLRATILSSAKKGGEGRTVMGTTVTEFTSISGEDERVLNNAPDDYGTSYYFRGNVLDNYVNFANMCWRIVRIDGDGNIKLILEDQDNSCSDADGNWSLGDGNFGYTEYSAQTLTASDGTTQNGGRRYIMNYLNAETNSGTSMATIFKKFQIEKLQNYLNYLKSGNWCLQDAGYGKYNDNSVELSKNQILDNIIKGNYVYYDAYVRLQGKAKKENILKCNGTKMKVFGDNTTLMYVGTLTIDEIIFAGGNTVNNYLQNDFSQKTELKYWTLSPTIFCDGRSDCIYLNDMSFADFTSRSEDEWGVFRPSINLESNVIVDDGVGTKDNPYTVKLS